MKKRLICLLLALALLLCVPAALADTVANSATDTGLDVVIVIDRSGTMLKTDPNSIALAATKMFADRCNSNDNSVAIITYGYNVLYESGFYDLSTSGNVEQLRMAVDACTIQDRNEDTNTGLALQRAYETIDQRRSAHPNHSFAILLLSDGQIDVGDSEAFKNANAKDASGATRSKDELAAIAQQEIANSASVGYAAAGQCAADGIPIYCLGIYSESKNILGTDMQQWATQTGGDYQITSNINDVFAIVRSMYLAMTNNPSPVPVVDGRFTIGDNVLEANIEIVPSIAAAQLVLKNPGGQPVDLTGGDPSVELRQDSQYTMIKLKKPAVGDWMLEFGDGIAHNYDVKVTYNRDLNMMVSLPETVVNGTPVNIELTATKQNDPYYDPNQPALLKVTAPDGSVTQQVMTWDPSANRYYYAFTPYVLGEYRFLAEIQTADMINHSTEALMKSTSRPLTKVQDLGDCTFSGHVMSMYTPVTWVADLRSCFSDPDARGIAQYEVTLSEPDYILADVDVNGALTYTALKPTVTPITVTVIARDGLGEPSEPVVGTVTVVDGQLPLEVEPTQVDALTTFEIRALLPQKEGVVALDGLSGYFIEPNAVDGEYVASVSAAEEVAPGGTAKLDVQVVNDQLVLTGLSAGTANVVVTGVSSDPNASQASFTLRVTVVNLMTTILMIVGGVLGALLLIVIVIVIVVKINKPAFKSGSSLTVTLYDGDEHEGSDMLRKYQKRKVKLSEICRKSGMTTGQFGSYLDKIVVVPRKNGILVQCNLKNVRQKELTLRPYDSRTIDIDPDNDLSIKLEYYVS